jgi:outer membrane immunogenic protein
MPTIPYEVAVNVIFRQQTSRIVVRDTDTTFAQCYSVTGNERLFDHFWGLEMNRFAVVGAGLLSLVGFVGAASAADLPARTYTKAPAIVAPVYDWSGFYIGLNGGGASSHECWTITSDAGVAIVPNAREGCHNATGGLAGGQIGYRWQAANWVFGVEAQGDWANLRGSNASLTVLIPATNQTKIDAIGLFTGQFGYAWNNVLLYVKGGAAVTDNKYSTFFTATGVVYNQASDTRWGGTVGTGIEVGVAPNWSVAVEYDHLFMGRPNITFPASAIAVTRSDNIGQGVDMGTVRVNYRFGGPVVARY